MAWTYGFQIGSMMQNSYFVLLLPWLLTFAIVFGILAHYEIPKSKSARAIISIVIAFFTLPFAGPILSTIQGLGTGLILVIMGIIFLLILFELTGTRHRKGEPKAVGPGGELLGEEERIQTKKITEKYAIPFAVVVIIIAFLVFIGAGGLDVLGITIPSLNYSVLFFLGIMVLAIFWMLASEE